MVINEMSVLQREKLYLKRTSPVEKYGCRDCEKKSEYLKNFHLTDKQIEKVLKGGAEK